MSNMAIQWLMVYAVLGLALFFLARQFRAFSGGGKEEGCGGCSSCPGTEMMEKRLASLNDD